MKLRPFPPPLLLLAPSPSSSSPPPPVLFLSQFTLNIKKTIKKMPVPLLLSAEQHRDDFYLLLHKE